jgi:RNA polymerase sigma-70 factor (ECF subfamily)
LTYGCSYTEKDLLARMAEGDEAAFTFIFNQYQGKLYSVGVDITHSPEIAEEIVQDVFLKLWLKKEKLSLVESFSGYLFIIMRNEALDWLVKQARRRRLLSRIVPEKIATSPLTDEFMKEQEFVDLLQKALNQLPRQQQEVFRLIRQEGFSRDQAARALKIDPNTVKTHMSRAVKALRAWYLVQGELLVTAYFIFRDFF